MSTVLPLASVGSSQQLPPPIQRPPTFDHDPVLGSAGGCGQMGDGGERARGGGATEWERRKGCGGERARAQVAAAAPARWGYKSEEGFGCETDRQARRTR